jgi:uncharacterized surface protein with fasciclin (FAS1) repeats
MKTMATRMSPIAAAIALSLGTGIVNAQDDSIEEAQSAIERSAEQAENAVERSAEQTADAVERGAEQTEEAIEQTADRVESVVEGTDDAEEKTTASGMGIETLTTRNEELSTFVDAVKAAGLEESLTDGTDYTLFAPTNDAFEGQDLESLMQPENREQLVSILRAHIVADDLDRDLAGTIKQAKTIDGSTVDVSVDGDKLMVGDVEASLDNGIQLGNLRIYAVNGVLEPQSMSQQNRQAAVQPAQ